MWTPAQTVERAKRLYMGIGLGPADTARMVGVAIAETVGVHPNTVDNWVKSHGWVRPAWYRKPRPTRPGKPRETLPKLRAAIIAAVEAGEPMPCNIVLARRFECTVQTVMKAMRQLVAEGAVSRERSGPRRRLRLADGRTSGWSILSSERVLVHRLPVVAAPAVKPTSRKAVEQPRPGPAPTMPQRVLALLEEAARAGKPCPTNLGLAAQLGTTRRGIERAFRQLLKAGFVKSESGAGRRRVELANGSATALSSGAPPMTLQARRPLDYAASAAATSLRRQGLHVFDLAVHGQRAWGEAWSIDGRVVDRDGLLAEAARREAMAMERLRRAA